MLAERGIRYHNVINWDTELIQARNKLQDLKKMRHTGLMYPTAPYTVRNQLLGKRVPFSQFALERKCREPQAELFHLAGKTRSEMASEQQRGLEFFVDYL